MSKLTRVLILRPTRCDIREYGAEDARVESVEQGEVYEVINECAENLFHSAAACVTDKPVKNRFATKSAANPATVVTSAPPKGPITATAAKAIIATK